MTAQSSGARKLPFASSSSPTSSEKAPNLTDDEWVHCDGTVKGIVGIITSGVSKEQLVNKSYPFNMRGAAGMKLSEEDIQALAAYVHSLSQ